MSRNVTSIQTAIDAPGPRYLSVTTTTGFNQGDLVFQNGSDFQQLTSQSTSAVFPNNVVQPILSGPLGGAGGSIGFPQSTTSTNTSGGSGNRNAALLTNGNIVISGTDSSSTAFFTIYNTSFNIVVSRVTLPNTFPAGATTGVIALTGGNFVIYYTDNTGRFVYAIYSNTGSVVTAVQQATDYQAPGSSWTWQVTSLSNGGFAATTTTGAQQLVYYIFNSTGTKLFNSALSPTPENTSVVSTITAGASGSFFILYRANSNEYRYALINSSNTTLASGSFTHNLASIWYGFASVATLSDGITVVLFYLSDSNTAAYRFFNTSTYALSSPTTIANAPLVAGSYSNHNSFAVRPLSSGFILFFQVNSNTFNGTTGMQYAVFNSSGIPLGNSTQTSLVPVYRSIYQNPTTNSGWTINTSLSTIEAGGNLNIFFNPFAGSGSGGTRAYTKFIRLDLNTYNPVSTLTYTAPIGSTTSSTGSVAFSGSTPNRISYFPLANSVAQTVPNFSVTTPTRVAALVSTNTDACTLTNGNFVIVYRNETTYAITAQVYNPLGILLATIFVGTGSNTTQYYCVRITPLASGKFVIAYSLTTTILSVNIFSANYGITNTFLLTNLSIQGGFPSTSQVFSLGSINSDRFVITAYSNANNSNTYWVYSNTGTQLATGAIALSHIIDVNGFQSGGFVVSYYLSGSAQIGVGWWAETATNTFANQNNTLMYSVSSAPYGGKTHINQFNEVFITSPNSQSCGTALACTNNNGDWLNYTKVGVQSVNNVNFAVPTPYGLRAIIDLGPTTTTLGLMGSSNYIVSNTTSIITALSGTSTAVAIPLYGNNVVLVYPNSKDNNFVYFSIITTHGSVGVNVLNTSSSVSSSTSFSAPNYPFIGVAANTAPPGGVGMVQTTGSAQLNSNYGASTPSQAFDYQTPGGLGVRGILSGRNITLLGSTQ